MWYDDWVNWLGIVASVLDFAAILAFVVSLIRHA